MGAQIFIQFQDAENVVVGEQISVDSFSNKAELNQVLQEILRDAGVSQPETHYDQVYQFFLGENEVRNSIQEAIDR